MGRRPMTDMPRTSRLMIALSPDEHRRLKIKAAIDNVSMADVVRRFLLAWEHGKVILPEVDNGAL